MIRKIDLLRLLAAPVYLRAALPDLWVHLCFAVTIAGYPLGLIGVLKYTGRAATYRAGSHLVNGPVGRPPDHFAIRVDESGHK